MKAKIGNEAKVPPLKTVSASPFKNNQFLKEKLNVANTGDVGKPQGAGKIKISSQFLQQANAATTAPVNNRPINAINKFQSNNVPAPVAAMKQEEIVVEPKVESPPPVVAYETLQPPAFLKQQIKSDDEDDEWGDNPEPIKITPTFAPLATYDEHEESYSSPNKVKNGHLSAANNGNQNCEYNDFGHNQNDVGNTIVPLNVTGLTAIALYDYQANDNDEISFDPNDTITEIVQVCYFGRTK